VEHAAAVFWVKAVNPQAGGGSKFVRSHLNTYIVTSFVFLHQIVTRRQDEVNVVKQRYKINENNENKSEGTENGVFLNCSWQ
jgi:hypothetical protein